MYLSIGHLAEDVTCGRHVGESGKSFYFPHRGRCDVRTARYPTWPDVRTMASRALVALPHLGSRRRDCRVTWLRLASLCEANADANAILYRRRAGRCWKRYENLEHQGGQTEFRLILAAVLTTVYSKLVTPSPGRGGDSMMQPTARSDRSASTTSTNNPRNGVRKCGFERA